MGLPPGRRSVKSEWVFKFKEGRTHRAKGAMGYTHIPDKLMKPSRIIVARAESLHWLPASAALEGGHKRVVQSASQRRARERNLSGVLTRFHVAGQGTRVRVTACRRRCTASKRPPARGSLLSTEFLMGSARRGWFASVGVCRSSQGGRGSSDQGEML